MKHTNVANKLIKSTEKTVTKLFITDKSIWYILQYKIRDFCQHFELQHLNNKLPHFRKQVIVLWWLKSFGKVAKYCKSRCTCTQLTQSYQDDCLASMVVIKHLNILSEWTS